MAAGDAVAGGVTRDAVYEASGALIEIDGVGGAKTDYIRASGMTLARIAGSTVTWLHHDHLGSAVAGTNAAGAVAWRESEQPFGEDWVSAAANDNQAGYTGHVEDAATGLTYMQARYYDPVIGRFLSIDPVGFSPMTPSMFNRYAYAGNDPVNKWDRDGRTCFDKNGELACKIDNGGEHLSAADRKAFEGAYLQAVKKLLKSPEKVHTITLRKFDKNGKPTGSKVSVKVKAGDLAENLMSRTFNVGPADDTKTGDRMKTDPTDNVTTIGRGMFKTLSAPNVRLPGVPAGLPLGTLLQIVIGHEGVHGPPQGDYTNWDSRLGMFDHNTLSHFKAWNSEHQVPHNEAAQRLLGLDN